MQEKEKKEANRKGNDRKLENILKNTTMLAHAICENYLAGAANPVAVDATCGNGHDTLWLAQRCSKVYGFDIQPEAIENTQKLLEQEGLDDKTELICDSHERMADYVKETVQLIIFNLGYLPGGDKTITTGKDTTLAALKQALAMLERNGLLCVVMYWGHPSGKEERKAALEWAAMLDKGIYHCVHTDMINQSSCPPEILFVTRKR